MRKRRSKYTQFACSVDIMLESNQLPTLQHAKLAYIDYFLSDYRLWRLYCDFILQSKYIYHPDCGEINKFWGLWRYCAE